MIYYQSELQSRYNRYRCYPYFKIDDSQWKNNCRRLEDTENLLSLMWSQHGSQLKIGRTSYLREVILCSQRKRLLQEFGCSWCYLKGFSLFIRPGFVNYSKRSWLDCFRSFLEHEANYLPVLNGKLGPVVKGTSEPKLSLRSARQGCYFTRG